MMNEIPINELEVRLKERLQKESYCKSYIVNHAGSLKYLVTYMECKGLQFYSPMVGELFADYVLNPQIRAKPTRYAGCLSLVKWLDDIIENRPHLMRWRQVKKHPLMGESCDIYVQYLNYLHDERRLSEGTIKHCLRVLSRLSEKMRLTDKSIENICWDDIVSFLSESNQKRGVFYVLKCFTGYLYENDIIREDFSNLFNEIKIVKKEKIPSYYTSEEVLKIERSAVKIRTCTGIRNYAMLLLASRLGLRSSDIRKLKFSNLDWDNNLIVLEQYKTKRPISLPLLDDVGNAIIDYVKNGRPQSNSKNVFILHKAPYGELSTECLNIAIRGAVHESGVDYTYRRQGPHSLRHSFATAMLNDGIGLPVISEALGHEETQSTMYYLGVNVVQLIECSLDVPITGSAFYEQKGGMFYD
jgi:site-specific recombinase XerD